MPTASSSLARPPLAPRTAATLALLALLAPAGLRSQAPPTPPPAEAPQPLTIDDLFEGTTERPGDVTWHPSGDYLTYVWDDGEGDALWRMDPVTGEATVILRPGETSLGNWGWLPSGTGLLRVEDGEISTWQLDGDGAEEGTNGLRPWTGNDAQGAAEGDAGVEGSGDGQAAADEREGDEVEQVHLSPEGDRVAFSRGANLHVLDLSTGEVRALTTDGEPGVTLNASTPWVYWEEIWGRDSTALWWSPDGERIAFYRFDETPVGTYPLLEMKPAYPEITHQKYPKSGTANPGVRIGVVELSTGEITWLDTEADTETYLARVHWAPAGWRGKAEPSVLVERLNRDQTELDVLHCDAEATASRDEAGDAPCRVILEERWPTWVNLGNETRVLADGSLLWASDRSGWRHLYRQTPQGELLALTSGPWEVTSLDHVDEEAGQLIFSGYAPAPLGAAERWVYRAPLSPRPAAPSPEAAPEDDARDRLRTDLHLEALTPTRGWHGVRVSPDGRYWVHDWSTADDPGWQRLEAVPGAVGEDAAEEVADGGWHLLPSTAARFEAAELPRWRLTTIPAEDGTALPARLLLPPGVDEADLSPRSRHPALMFHYGGPDSQVVVDRWDRGRGLWHKLMAQRGFVVLSVDNPASSFFGKAGEDQVHRRFGEVNLAAQRAGARYLASLPFVDSGRIGLWGWSGGGSNTLYCLFRSPGTWAAGVAGAPVTDWAYYDTIWTERYLDHPDDNPEGYRDSSVVTWAENLEDSLLLVHGTADDNVHPQNTLALSQVLIDAGKPFEQAIYPGQKHGLRGDASRHFYERMTKFFRRELGAPRPIASPSESALETQP